MVDKYPELRINLAQNHTPAVWYLSSLLLPNFLFPNV
jgi:hypothetical protein